MGILFLEADITRQRALARRETERHIASFGGALTVVAVLWWVYLYFALSRRVTRLVAGAERFASGDLETRIGMASRDELGRVAAAFDQMAATVGRDQTRLRENEETLRQQLAGLERGVPLRFTLRNRSFNPPESVRQVARGVYAGQ